MTSTLKTTATPAIGVAQFADGNGIDYADFNTAFAEVNAVVDTAESRVSISAADTYTKHLNDALTLGTGLSKSISNPAADEALLVSLDSKLVNLIALLTAAGKVQASGMDSGAAPSGYVATANGTGGVSYAAAGGGGAQPVDVTGTAGEALALRDAVYLESDFKWYKIDTDVTPVKCGDVRGIVTQAAGIANAASGTIRILGEVTGFTGLTAWAEVYASTTAGGITQTKPSPTLGGAQVAVAELGFATATNAVMVMRNPVQYMKRATLANNAALTLQHHSDPQGRIRLAKAYMSSTSPGASLTSYASSNQDVDVLLRNNGTTTKISQLVGGSLAINIGSSTVRWRAQSFTPTVTGTVTQFEFSFLANVGTPSGTLTWEIRANSAGAPTGAILDTGTLTPTPSAWNTITPGTPPSVTSGTVYWLVLKPTTVQTGTNAWQIDTVTPEVSAGGTVSTWDGTSWTAGTVYDATFTVSVTVAVTSKDKLAQSFQIPSTTTVDQVVLWLRKVGTPTGTLTLRLETDTAGAPSGTLANANATITVAESTLATSYGNIVFDFAVNFTLTATTTYWAVLSTDRTASATNWVEWGADGSSPGYASGSMSSNTGSWGAESKDAIFDVKGVGTTFDEPCVMGRSSAGTRDVAVRYDDGAGANPNTQTNFTNVTGSSADITVVVEMVLMIEYVIEKDAPNGLKTRAITLLLNRKQVVKRVEFVIPKDEAVDAAIEARADALWREADPLEDGLLTWRDLKKNRALIHKLYFNFDQQLSSGGDVADMMAIARQLLSGGDGDLLKDYQVFHEVLMKADDDKRWQLISLLLFGDAELNMRTFDRILTLLVMVTVILVMVCLVDMVISTKTVETVECAPMAIDDGVC